MPFSQGRAGRLWHLPGQPEQPWGFTKKADFIVRDRRISLSEIRRGPQEKVDFSPGKNRREFFSDLYILGVCQMPLLSLGENSPNSGSCGECFPFAPEAVSYGPALDRDIAIFHWLCSEVGLPPSAPMLLLAGDEYARQLFLRRAATKPDWVIFMAAFGDRHPDIMTKRVAAEAAVKAIPTGCPGWKSILTVPEIVLGWHLLTAVPAGMDIRRDQPLQEPGAAGLWRADYVVSTSQCAVWVEMAGMLDEAGQAQTTNALRYLNRQPDRMRAYEAAGLNPPVTVFAGELFGAARRQKMLERILGSIVG